MGPSLDLIPQEVEGTLRSISIPGNHFRRFPWSILTWNGNHRRQERLASKGPIEQSNASTYGKISDHFQRTEHTWLAKWFNESTARDYEALLRVELDRLSGNAKIGQP